MNDTQSYANQWNVSAQFFYDKKYYSWMEQAIEDFHTVVEIGCGTGYSTLALIEKGHKVIAIDKNATCIAEAKKLLDSKGVLDDRVVFIEGDIVEDYFRDEIVSTFSFDIVVCWNVGSYWNKEMVRYYLPYMHEYGLENWQISENPESSYSELIIWETCRLAKVKEVAVHIIDRSTEIINENNDPYYKLLKNEFEYDNIFYNCKKAKSISNGGRQLSTNGVVNNSNMVDIIFASILIR